MKRVLARNDMNINEFERRLSDETKAWIKSDVAARVMYDRIIDATNNAKGFYDAAERNEVTRWVPENGKGDCCICPLAEADAEAALVLRLALSGYALMIGKRDVSHNIDQAGQIACLINEPDEPAKKTEKKTEKNPARGKRVCKTNIMKCLNESWYTGGSSPINKRWTCGITIEHNSATWISAFLECDGVDVANFSASCSNDTPKKDIFEYCAERMMQAYKNHVKYERIDLDAIDRNAVIDSVGKKYDYLYDNRDEVDGYDEMMEFGEWLIKHRVKFVSELVKIRHDVFSSDREVAALGFAVNELAA